MTLPADQDFDPREKLKTLLQFIGEEADGEEEDKGNGAHRQVERCELGFPDDGRQFDEEGTIVFFPGDNDTIWGDDGDDSTAAAETTSASSLRGNSPSDVILRQNRSRNSR